MHSLTRWSYREKSDHFSLDARDPTFYKWHAKFEGMNASDTRRLHELEGGSENSRNYLPRPNGYVPAWECSFVGIRSIHEIMAIFQKKLIPYFGFVDRVESLAK